MAHLELGRAIFKKVKDELFFVAKVERDAKMEGRRMTMVLQPDHKNPDAVRPGSVGTTPPAAAKTGDRLNIPQRPAGATPTGPSARVAQPAAAPVPPAVSRPAPSAVPQTAGANR